MEVGAEPIVVEAWGRRAFLDGMSGKPMLEGRSLVEALATHEISNGYPRAVFYNSVGVVLGERGQRAEARAALKRAIEEFRDSSGLAALEVLTAQTNLAQHADDDKERDAIYGAVVASATSVLGAEHPSTLTHRLHQAAWTRDLTLARTRMDAACNDARRLRVLSGEVAICTREVALLSDELGDRSAAVAAMRQVTDAKGARLGRPPPESYLALWEGRFHEAMVLFTAHATGIARRNDEPWWITKRRAESLLGQAQCLSALRDPTSAQRLLDDVIRDMTDASSRKRTISAHRLLARAHAERVATMIATRAPSAEIQTEARVAADALRAEGGRPDEIAALERLAVGADRVPATH